MAQNSILLDKSLLFAARIVKLNKYLTKEKKETVISKQIIRSATSIGANANEAIYGQSKADFIAKLQISLKETAETEYWLRLLILSDNITDKEGNSLLDDCLEIKRILISTLKTAKNINKKSRKTFILQGVSALCHFRISFQKLKIPLARIFYLSLLTIHSSLNNSTKRL